MFQKTCHLCHHTTKASKIKMQRIQKEKNEHIRSEDNEYSPSPVDI